MTAGEMLSKLSGFYGKKVSPEFVAQYNSAMSRYSSEVLQRVYDHTTYHDEKFASLSSLRDFAEFFRDEIEKKKHQAQKRQENEPIKVETHSTAKNVLMLIKAGMSGAVTRRVFLDCMKEMRFETGTLEDFYQKRGCDLSKPCGHGIWRVE